METKFFQLSDDEQHNLFLEAITPKPLDPTFAVLKAHLLVEELMSEYLTAKVWHGIYLDQARLSFAQKLALARSMSPRGDDDWSWGRLTLLNSLAHKRDVSHAKAKIDEFIREVKHIGPPMPGAALSVPTGEFPPGPGPWYTQLDMALMATIALAALLLGLDVAGKLPPMKTNEPAG